MLYSCTHMATVGVKGLIKANLLFLHVHRLVSYTWFSSSVSTSSSLARSIVTPVRGCFSWSNVKSCHASLIPFRTFSMFISFTDFSTMFFTSSSNLWRLRDMRSDRVVRSSRVNRTYHNITALSWHQISQQLECWQLTMQFPTWWSPDLTTITYNAPEQNDPPNCSDWLSSV